MKKTFNNKTHQFFFSFFMQIWLVGDGLTNEEQMKAPKGTTFIPFSQLPPRIVRKDCFYHCTPAMKAPRSIENVHSCEVHSTQLCLYVLERS